jgi:hypothetical protein
MQGEEGAETETVALPARVAREAVGQEARAQAATPFRRRLLELPRLDMVPAAAAEGAEALVLSEALAAQGRVE